MASKVVRQVAPPAAVALPVTQTYFQAPVAGMK